VPEPSPHPLNTGFTWSAPKGPYRAISAEQARAYDEQGFFVYEDAFDADTIREVRELIDPMEQKTEDFLETREDKRLGISRAGEITFTTHLVTRSEVLKNFCRSRVFADLTHDLLGDDVRLYWDQAVYKKPETAKEFPWHQDNGYTFVEPQQYLTCWVALTDATVENGCPWVIPGAHRNGTLAHWTTDLGYQCVEHSDEAVPAEAKAGSIVVFSSLTPHRTGPNATRDVRKAYIVQFAPDGAMIRFIHPKTGEETVIPANAPDRQYPVLEAGTPVGA